MKIGERSGINNIGDLVQNIVLLKTFVTLLMLSGQKLKILNRLKRIKWKIREGSGIKNIGDPV